MNSDQMKGKWKQLKGSVKERWGKLTDDDLDVISGQQDQLVGKIQERYGIARDEAQKQFDEWSALNQTQDSQSVRETEMQEQRKETLEQRRKAS